MVKGKFEDVDLNDKFYGAKGNNWLGIVLPFDSQEEQLKGQGGFGYRRRVAIMGHHPSTGEIKDSNITFALVQLGVTDGSGAANRSKKVLIAQGDVVVGYFLDGDAKQNPIITGVLGRTKGIKYGKGRFDIKSGYGGGGTDKKLALTYTDEASGDNPPCFPLAINTTSKQDRVEATEQTEKGGVSTEPETDTLKEPPIDEETQKRIDEKVAEKVEEGMDEDEAIAEAKDEVDEELREEASNVEDYTVMGVTYDGNTGLPKEIQPEDTTESISTESTVDGITSSFESTTTESTTDGITTKTTEISSSVQGTVIGGVSSDERMNKAIDRLNYEKERRDLIRAYGRNSEQVKAFEAQRSVIGVNTYNEKTNTNPTPILKKTNTKPTPIMKRETGDPGERTAPKLDRDGTPERKLSITEKYLMNKGIDLTKTQGGLTNDQYNDLSSRDRKLLTNQLKLSDQRGELDTTSNPNTTNLGTGSGKITIIREDGSTTTDFREIEKAKMAANKPINTLKNNVQKRMTESRESKTTIGQSLANNAQQQNEQYNNWVNNEINKLEWKKNLRSSSEQDKINFQKQITTLENDRNNVNNKFKTSS